MADEYPMTPTPLCEAGDVVSDLDGVLEDEFLTILGIKRSQGSVVRGSLQNQALVLFPDGRAEWFYDTGWKKCV